MGLSPAGKNVMLDAWGAVAVWLSLHDGDPGTTGANELAGGSPAYARQLGAWDPATGGVITLAGSETFDVPASSDVTHFGAWSVVSGGTFYGGGVVSLPESFNGQGIYILDDTTSFTQT
ncbi:phage tail fiber protein [Actinomadura rugatobispora]|uniref:Uncharacterized protein n=1 Tax=Actinomadura rugatobispora TaxID=1994 RepID=A0ABW0ZNI2_9ACTN|nr:hypothetical protein GCM10010200_036520 [Actinomadura rugatobispora]